MSETMRLYIWAGPYRVSYGTSMAIAVASSVEEAKTLLAAGVPSYAFVDCPGDAIPPHTLGEPTRVVDLPCAEWHTWAE